jgi:hypothetical protein
MRLSSGSQIEVRDKDIRYKKRRKQVKRKRL